MSARLLCLLVLFPGSGPVLAAKQESITRLTQCALDISRLARPEKTAALVGEVGLHYATDAVPGFVRETVSKKKGKKGKFEYEFVYRDKDGKRLTNAAAKELVERLAKLKIRIPPAWEDVWINPDVKGHVQVTGWTRNAHGEPTKTYLYHPLYNHVRDIHKFDHNTHFGKILTDVRAQAFKDLKLKGMPKEKVVAAAVLLLDTSYIRPGSKESAKKMGRYGLTTLRKSHLIDYGPEEAHLRFIGKHGVRHDHHVPVHEELFPVLQELESIKGANLFQYQDSWGKWRPITPADLTDYIYETAGNGFTAKNFRTWGATALAVEYLAALPMPTSEKQKKANWQEAKSLVSSALGNEPNEAGKSYIDPLVKDAYFENPQQFLVIDRPLVGRRRAYEEGLTEFERRTLRFLEALRGE